MTGILKVDQWKDSGDNALMTSDGAGNLTCNVNLGIGTSSPDGKLHIGGISGSVSGIVLETTEASGDTNSIDFHNLNGDLRMGIEYDASTADLNIVKRDRTKIVTFDESAGNVLVGTTDTDPAFNNVVGQSFAATGQIQVTRDGGTGLLVNRKTSEGEIVSFRKDGGTIGIIGTEGGDLIVGTGDTGVQYCDSLDSIRPWNTSTNAGRDGLIDLGTGNVRYQDIYATNGTIQTSDQNEKQSIQLLTSSEIAVAKRISKLFKTFKFNSAVEEKGDNARTHTGVIAQEVQQAFTDEGLDASNYALFISSTWWEKEISVDAVAEELDEEGNVIVEGKDAYTYIDTKEEATEGYTERTRLGIRYPELLSFVSSAFEQRLTNIETRLATLENA